MNIMQMMQQAQKMQKKLKEAQEELANAELTATGANGLVEIVCDGQGRIKAVKLKGGAINPENPQAVDSDTIETLEDLLLTTIQNAQKKASEEMENKTKAITGGISIPGLF